MKSTNLYKKRNLDLVKNLGINYDFHIDYGFKKVDLNYLRNESILSKISG